MFATECPIAFAYLLSGSLFVWIVLRIAMALLTDDDEPEPEKEIPQHDLGGEG